MQKANNHDKKTIIAVISCLMVLLFHSAQASSQTIEWTRRVKEGQNHAAFTSLEYYKGYFYCSFREANYHVDKNGNDNGIITILKSRNGRRWRLCGHIIHDGYDLRDPKLSITPDNRLMLISEAVKYVDGKDVSRKTVVSFLKRSYFDGLEEVIFNPNKTNNWLWDVTWIGTQAKGFLYCPAFYAVSSTNGLEFDILQEYRFTGFPTEAALTTLDDGRIIVILRISGQNSKIGVGDGTLKDIQWYDAGCRVEGPDIINIKGDIYVCGRSFEHKIGVSLYKLDMNSHLLNKLIELPASGDCSYPGMVFVNNRLYVSYHSTSDNKTSVYFSRIKL